VRREPAVLVLSRQPLPTLDRGRYASASGVARGAYVLADAPGGKPDVILIASGSEVPLAIDAHERLISEGIRSRISMPSWDLFEHQSLQYRNSVLPPEVTARVAVDTDTALDGIYGSIARPKAPQRISRSRNSHACSLMRAHPHQISIRATELVNSEGQHKRRLRGGSFHTVHPLPRARVQVPGSDSMERPQSQAPGRR
jgi:hypothetical protein